MQQPATHCLIRGVFNRLVCVPPMRCQATTVTPQPQQRFDQAGLMVLLSESCWLKTSVEHGGDGR